MILPSDLLKNLSDEFTKLPGIGKRTASRIVLNLLKLPEEDISRLSTMIAKLKTDIHSCKICNNLCEDEICSICSDSSRDHSLVCIIEDVRDLIAIENTSQYKGSYHILGGLINPVEGIKPDQLAIDSLIKRIDDNTIHELIFALSATLEGDTTMYYIARLINSRPIKVSNLARGISVGGVLEYADEITLGRAIINRIPYSTNTR